MKLKKFILLIFIAFACSGCGSFFDQNGFLRQFHPGGTSVKPPPGPAIYQQGFREGCESGYSGYRSSLRKLYWTWKQNPELAQNRVYYQIWKDAYAFCASRGNIDSLHGLGNFR